MQYCAAVFLAMKLPHIKIRPRGLLYVVLAVIAVAALFTLRHSSPAPKPLLCDGVQCNVIMIVLNAVPAGHLSAYGYPRSTTPYIDEFFGRNGTIFLNAWSNANWTVPSYVSILNSKYPDPRHMKVDDLVHLKEPTLTGLLRKNGVSLQVFDSKYNFVSESVLRYFNEDETTIAPYGPLKLSLAAQWINAAVVRGENPFFALIRLNDTHVPYTPPQAYRALFNPPVPYPAIMSQDDVFALGLGKTTVHKETIDNLVLQYDQTIRYIDDLIKKFTETQLSEETLRRTIIVLMSDHGEKFYEHGNTMHGGKFLYEEDVHIPLLFHIPDETPKSIATPVSLVDMAPTILGIYGIKSPSTYLGSNILSASDISTPRILRAYGADTYADVLLGESLDTYVARHTGDTISEGVTAALRLGEWKLIRYGDGSQELYNLDHDPREQVDYLHDNEKIPLPDQSRLDILLKEMNTIIKVVDPKK